MRSLRFWALPILVAISACAPVRQRAELPAYTIEPPAQLFAGVTYWRETRSDARRQIFHIVKVNLAEPDLMLFTTPPEALPEGEYRAQTTSDFLAEQKAQVAVNASYFQPFRPGSTGGDDFFPLPDNVVDAIGTVISEGREVSPRERYPDTRVNAILCISTLQVSIEPGQSCSPDVHDAIAAGPLLLDGGKRQPLAQVAGSYGRELHPRTAFGLSADRRTGWFVIVDGRQHQVSEGATLAELTQFFDDLGATDAINLDGGGSTTLVIEDEDGEPEVLNSPIHTKVPGRERPVANHIGIRAKPVAATSLPPRGAQQP